MRNGSPPRIGLFGLFGCGNSGNDGSLAAMVAFLRRVRPDAELVCICPGPERLPPEFDLPAIAIGTPGWRSPVMARLDRALLRLPQLVRSWVHTFHAARRLDLLIVPGTGALDDFGTGPRGAPFSLFRWSMCARAGGAHLWLVSIGAGPIRHPVSRWLMKAAAATAGYRSYRDLVSKRYMLSIGFDAQGDAIYPDLAFALPVPAVPSEARARDVPLTVGVGVMRYRGWRDRAVRGDAIYRTYLENMATFVLWLLEQGYRVRILTGDAMDASAVGDLQAIVTDAAGGLARERVHAAPTVTLTDLMQEIARCDIVVATRFHNVVCSLKLGRPVISIGYADKNDALLAEAGLGAFCQHIEQLDVPLLTEQFRAIVCHHAARVRDVRAHASLVQARLIEQDTRLQDMLDPGRSAAA